MKVLTKLQMTRVENLMLMKGYTPEEAASRIGARLSTVTNFVNSKNLKRNIVNEINIRKVKTLRRKGKSVEEISVVLDLKYNVVLGIAKTPYDGLEFEWMGDFRYVDYESLSLSEKKIYDKID